MTKSIKDKTDHICYEAQQKWYKNNQICFKDQQKSHKEKLKKGNKFKVFVPFQQY